MTQRTVVLRGALFLSGLFLGITISHNYSVNQLYLLAATTTTEASSKHKQSQRPRNPDVLYVFFAGIEGTGHHLLQNIYHDASTVDTFLEQHELRQQVVDIQKILYKNGNESSALFSGSASSLQKPHPGAPNGTAMFNTLVQALRETHQSVLQVLHDDDAPTSSAATQTQPFPIPLNTLYFGKGSGAMSYPNYIRPYRALQFPDLHLLYRACDAAAVECGHVYLHRNPYSVVRSTVHKRHFWPLEGQITLLSTMLQVLRGQLIDFPRNLVDCFDFDAAASERKNNIPLMHFLGISEENYTQVFNADNVAENLDLSSVVDPRVQVYMDTLVELSNTTMELCRHVRSSGQGWLRP